MNPIHLVSIALLLAACAGASKEQPRTSWADAAPPKSDRDVRLSLSSETFPDWLVRDVDGTTKSCRELRSRQGELVSVLLSSDRDAVIEIDAFHVRKELPADRYQRLWIRTREAGIYPMRIRVGAEVSAGTWRVE